MNNEVLIKGKKLKCVFCEGTNFTTRKTLLNTRLLTFINFDWANTEAINYICDHCGYIFWFADTADAYIEKIIKENQEDSDRINNDYEKSVADESECPNCFHNISKNDTECSYCGCKLK